MYEFSFSWTHALTIVFAFTTLFWWVIFHKAGKPSWYSMVPVLNVITLVNISGHPWWWIFLFFIPLVNVIVILIIWMDLAKAFGKGRGFGLGLYFFTPVFGLILALSDAQYKSPVDSSTPVFPDYKPKLSVTILLTLLALSIIGGFFVLNWIQPPFQEYELDDPYNLTASEIMQGTDEAKYILSGEIRNRRFRGTVDEALPVFHRLLVLVPILAGLMLIVVWLYLLKVIPHEVALVSLLNATALLAVLPFLWQNLTNNNLKLQMIDSPIAFIQRTVYEFSAWYNIEIPVMLGAFALAIVFGEYAVFLHDRRHLHSPLPASSEITPAVPA
jgi:hypothetical protein